MKLRGIAAAVTAALVGCSGSGSAAPRRVQADPAAASIPPAPDPQAEPVTFADLPGRWRPLPVFSGDATLYVPATTADLPPPLQWNPCPGERTGCRQVDVDWRTLPDDIIGGVPRADVQGDTITLQLRQLRSAVVDDGSKTLATLGTVQDLDGNVRHAILAASEPYRAPATWVLPGGVASEGAAWQVSRWEDGTLTRYAALRLHGDVGLRTAFDHEIEDPAAGVPLAGTSHLAVLGQRLRILDRDDALVWEDAGAAYDAWWSSDTLWWLEDRGSSTVLRRFDPGAGATSVTELAVGSRAGGDPSRVVCTEPLVAGGTRVSVTNVSGAAASNEAVAWLPGAPASAPVVGCGRAAIRMADAGSATIAVIDLEDGGVTHVAAAMADPWMPAMPVALSCRELVLTVVRDRTTSLRRVRLDPA